MRTDAWKNFEASGKVSDYLQYRQSVSIAGKAKEAETESRGIESDGTQYRSDGNDFKCNASG